MKSRQRVQQQASEGQKEETIPAPTVEERVASLKSLFESLPQDEVTFYQSFPVFIKQSLH